MPILQRIKRSNGSLVYSVNVPLELIEELGWEKGDELELESWNDDGEQIIKVFKKSEGCENVS